MIHMPENAPWWALVIFAVLNLFVFAGVRLWRHTWPQNSRDRRALLEARQRDRTERRRERDQRNQQGR